MYNVVLMVIDCLRADHVSSYDYPRQTTPNIDALSRKGLLLKNAYTQSTFTLASAATLLTGLYPETHNVLTFNDKLPGDFPTLPRVLQQHGPTFLPDPCRPGVVATRTCGRGDRIEPWMHRVPVPADRRRFGRRAWA